MASRVWKLNGRRGIAYVEGKETAEQVIALCGNSAESRLADAAMAEYRDKKGKAFAWQIPFDLSRWDAIAEALAAREHSSA